MTSHLVTSNPDLRPDLAAPQSVVEALRGGILERAETAEVAGLAKGTLELMAGDHHLNPGIVPLTSLRQAAVLIPIIEHASQPQVLLTQRARHLAKHAGQISFPGGRSEDSDPDLAYTALRETHEEVGLAPDLFEMVGALPPYVTGTGFSIAPYIGIARAPLQTQADPSEVDEIFEVPLAFLLDPKNHQRHSRIWQGQTRYFWAIPYQQRYIWGATAGILVNLSRLLRA